MKHKNPYEEGNPYAEPGGFPIDGKEEEFFKWGRDRELERRKTLPPELVRQLEESENALARRMNS